MLFNDVIMTPSPIKVKLVYNYVDRGPISIPTKFQTNTPNNKDVTVVVVLGLSLAPLLHCTWVLELS